MVNVYRSRLAGMSFAFDDGTSYYVPSSTGRGNLPAYEHRRLANAVDCERTAWIHNAKHEYKALARWGALAEHHGRRRERRVALHAGRLLARRARVARREVPYALKELAPTYLGIDMSSFDDTTGGWTSASSCPRTGSTTRARTPRAALRLGREVVTPRLREWGLEDWYRDVEMPFLFLLREMEDAGMALDRERHGRIIEGLGGGPGTRRAMGVPHGRLHPVPKRAPARSRAGHLGPAGASRKATGPSTERSSTSGGSSTAARRVSGTGSRRSSSTTRRSGARRDGRPQARGPRRPIARTGDCTNFLQTGTATGRLSSSCPTCRTSRSAPTSGKRIRGVRPRAGHVYLSADYSQIPGCASWPTSRGSGRLLDSFCAGTDVHQETADLASSLLNLPFTPRPGEDRQLRPHLRGRAKTRRQDALHHGRTGQAFLDAHAEITQVTACSTAPDARVSAQLRPHARGPTPERGHRPLPRPARRVPTRDSGTRPARSTATPGYRHLGKEGRHCPQHPIRGRAADVVKVDACWPRRSVPGKMVCQIHDDIVCEVPEGGRPRPRRR